ncbi:MAG TPA: phosphate ABC transporter substrate-binding protein PstS [Nocardioidaceae bacterium]|nr:phosphate ABC transporter substrate-binding protein PstS [Nocardioidaceae bacterium]
MNSSFVARTALPAAAALALGLGLSSCGAANEQPSSGGATGQGANATASLSGTLSGTLNGAGSSAQEAAQGGWTAKFQTSNPNATVNYDPVGSGGGVDEFLSGGVAFAGSDAYLSTDQVAESKKVCGGQSAIEVPDYISPIAVVYHLPGVDNLRLSPDTLAKIFAGTITQWNDPAIKADNPGATLPAQRITPVHRSDDSGTTDNFTDYLHQAAGDAWTYPASETWPVKSGEGADGTSGVVAAVQKGSGTVGYADASQAGQLSKAQIKVGSSWVGPTAAAASKAAGLSKPVSGRAASDLALSINRTTTESGAYPLVLVSYLIGCPTYGDANTAKLVKGYLTYIVSPQGQQVAAQVAGSAPLPSNLSQQATQQLADIAVKG